MSHHSLQQWDHYKRQMDQLMARPDFLTNLAQSAGAMSALVNNMLDPSVSDWSTATASGKPLLTSQEQVQFKEMLDPYVPYIRAFFKGEPLPHSGEQHGGAEDLVKKMQQKLTQNMTYMGQYNVIMYGGEGPLIDILGQKERNANRETKDVMVYPEPPINVPLRFITTSIVMLFDVIRMISSLVGWEKAPKSYPWLYRPWKCQEENGNEVSLRLWVILELNRCGSARYSKCLSICFKPFQQQ